jgi:predicted aldo/keto reductase-like oxidoreductase
VYKTPLFPLSSLKAAKILGINVISSLPFMSGLMLQNNLSKEVFKCHHNSARHLNFITSIPSKAIKSTLVGMKTPHHLEENLEVVYREKMAENEFFEYVMSVKDFTEGMEKK